jgi:signal peptidase II
VPVKPAFFYPIWLAIIFLLIIFWQKNDSWAKISLIFIISGAVSNLLDRLLRGCVIDFIDIKIWPVFNLADVYIIIGTATFLIFKILKSKS